MTPLEIDGILSSAVVRPGDRVLLLMDRTLTRAQAAEIREELGRRAAGVEFTLVCGASGAVVYRPDEVRVKT